MFDCLITHVCYVLCYVTYITRVSVRQRLLILKTAWGLKHHLIKVNWMWSQNVLTLFLWYQIIINMCVKLLILLFTGCRVYSVVLLFAQLAQAQCSWLSASRCLLVFILCFVFSFSKQRQHLLLHTMTCFGNNFDWMFYKKLLTGYDLDLTGLDTESEPWRWTLKTKPELTKGKTLALVRKPWGDKWDSFLFLCSEF